MDKAFSTSDPEADPPWVYWLDDHHVREKALYLSWLAEAHAYGDGVTQAAHMTGQALRLSAGVTSARSSGRIARGWRGQQ